jgi:hypothetical protein
LPTSHGVGPVGVRARARSATMLSIRVGLQNLSFTLIWQIS